MLAASSALAKLGLLATPLVVKDRWMHACSQQGHGHDCERKGIDMRVVIDSEVDTEDSSMNRD